MKLEAKLVTNWQTDRAHREMMQPIRRGLRSAAALVRRIARQDFIKRRKRPSEPGEGPTSQLGFLKKFVLFGEVDPLTYAVGAAPIRPGLVPSTLEHGGTARIKARRRDKSVARMTVRIEARPYMAPALERAQPKILPMIAGNP